MRRTALAVCALALAGLPPISAQTTPATTAARSAAPARAAAAPARLPVRRVVLYKNGVGYFEHLGTVRGDETVTIDFNSAQLNDVLKSLTALDLGDGRVTGISYNSQAPFAQQLGALRLPVGEHTTRAQLLDALRGARLEVRTAGGVVTGRLLGVEQRTVGRDESRTTRDELTVVSDTGEIRSVELTPAVTIKIAERDSSEQVGAYMGLLASTRALDRRRMAVETKGAGSRELLVSYVSEVPIWKTTYRVVLPSKAGGKPLLQGWAIVDNTVGEDWTGVELSLVAGAPQSFIQQLSQPLYGRRPVVPLPSAVMLTPQTHEPTLTTAESKAAPGPLLAETVTAANAPRGVVGGIVGGLAAPPAAAPSPSRATAGMAASARQVVPAAEARELGDLFEYHVSQPITIARNQSALVPILRGEVAGDRVSLWNGRTGGRPLRALWLTNTSGLTLDAGPFSVVDADAFAGEGLIEPMKPNEKRLISYAVDLGVQVEQKNADEQRTIRRITISRGVLVEHGEQVGRRVYTIRNSDTTDRRVVIEHPIRPGWKLAEGLTPSETSADAYRFAVTVPSARTETLTVIERQALGTTYEISQMDDRMLAVMLQESGSGEALRAALAPVIAKKAALAAIASDIDARVAEQRRIDADQQRVRENMKALKGTSEEQQLVKRYATELNQQEDRVEALRRELEDLQRKRQAAEAELAAAIEALNVDVNVTTR